MAIDLLVAADAARCPPAGLLAVTGVGIFRLAFYG
jgi:hypothetical protein